MCPPSNSLTSNQLSVDRFVVSGIVFSNYFLIATLLELLEACRSQNGSLGEFLLY